MLTPLTRRRTCKRWQHNSYNVVIKIRIPIFSMQLPSAIDYYKFQIENKYRFYTKMYTLDTVGNINRVVGFFALTCHSLLITRISCFVNAYWQKNHVCILRTCSAKHFKTPVNQKQGKRSKNEVGFTNSLALKILTL